MISIYKLHVQRFHTKGNFTRQKVHMVICYFYRALSINSTGMVYQMSVCLSVAFMYCGHLHDEAWSRCSVSEHQ